MNYCFPISSTLPVDARIRGPAAAVDWRTTAWAVAVSAAASLASSVSSLWSGTWLAAALMTSAAGGARTMSSDDAACASTLPCCCVWVMTMFSTRRLSCWVAAGGSTSRWDAASGLTVGVGVELSRHDGSMVSKRRDTAELDLVSVTSLTAVVTGASCSCVVARLDVVFDSWHRTIHQSACQLAISVTGDVNGWGYWGIPYTPRVKSGSIIFGRIFEDCRHKRARRIDYVRLSVSTNIRPIATIILDIFCLSVCKLSCSLLPWM